MNVHLDGLDIRDKYKKKNVFTFSKAHNEYIVSYAVRTV